MAEGFLFRGMPGMLQKQRKRHISSQGGLAYFERFKCQPQFASVALTRLHISQIYCMYIGVSSWVLGVKSGWRESHSPARAAPPLAWPILHAKAKVARNTTIYARDVEVRACLPADQDIPRIVHQGHPEDVP